jgi:prevent-host-death family protein
MATIVGVHAAKTTLSKLIDQATAGEDVLIVRDGVPVVRLVPVAPPRQREPGKYRGLGVLDDSFFDPLPTDELDQWERDVS